MTLPLELKPHRNSYGLPGDDMFTRAFWDDRIRSKLTDRLFTSYRTMAAPRRGDGFQAAIDSDTPVAPMQHAVDDPAKMSPDCAICMRVCPFNRSFDTWPHPLWLKRALSPLRKAALWLDWGRGGRKKPSDWWADPER